MHLGITWWLPTQVSGLASMAWGMEICLSGKFPDAANVAGPEAIP